MRSRDKKRDAADDGDIDNDRQRQRQQRRRQWRQRQRRALAQKYEPVAYTRAAAHTRAHAHTRRLLIFLKRSLNQSQLRDYF